MSTSRERFLAALKKEIPDRVPIFEFPFGQELQEFFIGYQTKLYDGKAAVKMANKLGIDGVAVFLGGYCGVQFFETDDDRYTDDWGIVYERKGWPITSQIKNPISGREDWDGSSGDYWDVDLFDINNKDLNIKENGLTLTFDSLLQWIYPVSIISVYKKGD